MNHYTTSNVRRCVYIEVATLHIAVDQTHQPEFEAMNREHTEQKARTFTVNCKSMRGFPNIITSFTGNEIAYLKHIMLGISSLSGMEEVYCQLGKRKGLNRLHIFEPFHALNQLDYGSPSVVGIEFTDENVIFYVGYDNGLDVFSDELEAVSVDYPKPFGVSPDMDFLHFVNSIGEPGELNDKEINDKVRFCFY